jgi:hypothetical protein
MTSILKFILATEGGIQSSWVLRSRSHHPLPSLSIVLGNRRKNIFHGNSHLDFKLRSYFREFVDHLGQYQMFKGESCTAELVSAFAGYVVNSLAGRLVD